VIPLLLALAAVLVLVAARQARAVTVDENAKELTPIQQMVYQAARAHDVEPAMVLAIIEHESHFDPAVVNKRDPSYGLGQVMAFWVPFFGLGTLEQAPAILLDPGFNADITARIVQYFFYEHTFTFPAEADIYNVGETLWRKGIRNGSYRDGVTQKFHRWRERL